MTNLTRTFNFFSIRGIITCHSASADPCYNRFIKDKKETLDCLIANFQAQGGRINKFYLQKKKGIPSLVYLNGWFRGRNIREAIGKAIAGQK